MKFVYDDGGRSKYFKGKTRDCVTRAISIATGADYKEIYDALNELAKHERTGKRKHSVSNARTGVYTTTIRRYMKDIGWKWVPCMSIGSGCSAHLSDDELPKGTIIVKLSHHLACVKDGVLYDTFDCTRGGNRCVYGYYIKD